MKSGNTTLERGHDSRDNGTRSCPTTHRAAATQSPLRRLTGIQPMTAAQQQRFEMLFDAMIAHWLARSETNEGKTHD